MANKRTKRISLAFEIYDKKILQRAHEHCFLQKKYVLDLEDKKADALCIAARCADCLIDMVGLLSEVSLLDEFDAMDFMSEILYTQYSVATIAISDNLVFRRWIKTTDTAIKIELILTVHLGEVK